MLNWHIPTGCVVLSSHSGLSIPGAEKSVRRSLRERGERERERVGWSSQRHSRIAGVHTGAAGDGGVSVAVLVACCCKENRLRPLRRAIWSTFGAGTGFVVLLLSP